MPDGIPPRYSDFDSAGYDAFIADLAAYGDDMGALYAALEDGSLVVPDEYADEYLNLAAEYGYLDNMDPLDAVMQGYLELDAVQDMFEEVYSDIYGQVEFAALVTEVEEWIAAFGGKTGVEAAADTILEEAAKNGQGISSKTQMENLFAFWGPLNINTFFLLNVLLRLGPATDDAIEEIGDGLLEDYELWEEYLDDMASLDAEDVGEMNELEGLISMTRERISAKQNLRDLMVEGLRTEIQTAASDTQQQLMNAILANF